MDAAQLIQLSGDALWLALMLAAPVLAVTWVVSLAGSALQSVLQLQDTTLLAVPKLLAGFATLWFAGHWMGDRLSAFTVELLRALPGTAP